MIEARARPEYAHVLLDLLVSDTEVIGRAAFRSDTQLVKNVFGTAKRKILFGPEAAGELEQDLGINARFSRRRHGLPDSRHATLGGGHGAFRLLMQRAGENNVRIVRGFVEEKINRAVKFQLL